jgi:two-component system, cell cycle response regulator DivK
MEMNDYNWKEKVILVVDNVEANYYYFMGVFRKTGVKIIWAENGKKAVEFCNTNPSINLVLMDIQMPELDGYEATKQIRKIRKDIPIIAQTAYAMDGVEEKSIQSGCDVYMSKPIDKEILKKKINNFFK